VTLSLAVFRDADGWRSRACAVALAARKREDGEDKENVDPSPRHRSPRPSPPAEQQQQNHSHSLLDLTRESSLDMDLSESVSLLDDDLLYWRLQRGVDASSMSNASLVPHDRSFASGAGGKKAAVAAGGTGPGSDPGGPRRAAAARVGPCHHRERVLRAVAAAESVSSPGTGHCSHAADDQTTAAASGTSWRARSSRTPLSDELDRLDRDQHRARVELTDELQRVAGELERNCREGTRAIEDSAWSMSLEW